MQTIFFHIGGHKTGTSAIQVALTKARPALAECNIIYPPSSSDTRARKGMITSGNGNLLANILWKNPANDRLAKNEMASLIGLLEASPKHSLLYSSETLENCAGPRFKHLVKALHGQGYNVKIIYYLRHLLDVAISMHGQLVKRRACCLPFATWVQTYRSPYRHVIRFFSEVVGRDNLVLRLYDDVRASLLEDFFSILHHRGPDRLKSFYSENVLVNRSLSQRELEVLLFINSLIQQHPGKDLISARISDAMLYTLPPRDEAVLLSQDDLETLVRNNLEVLTFVNKFVSGKFELKAKSDRISVGKRRPYAWQPDDKVFLAAIEALIKCSIRESSCSSLDLKTLIDG